MALHTNNLQLAIAMLLSGIIIAQWLASKKSFLIDFVAGILGLFIVACLLVQFKVF